MYNVYYVQLDMTSPDYESVIVDCETEFKKTHPTRNLFSVIFNDANTVAIAKVCSETNWTPSFINSAALIRLYQSTEMAELHTELSNATWSNLRAD